MIYNRYLSPPTEEGLEEESKRSLQMEIDLECLTNKYETEKSQAEERIRELEKLNVGLQTECDRVNTKLADLIASPGTNNNNLITNNKNLPDLGEGVRSTIVTFNNAIASLAGSTVANSCPQPRPNVVQSLQTKPSLAAKPSFDSAATNGKVTILSGAPAAKPEPPAKSNSVNNMNLNVSSNVNTSSPISPTTTTSTSVASVIQKFSNTISNNIPSHQPIVKKLSSSGLVANIAQSIVGGQTPATATHPARGKPPPVPNKPVINSQLLKERTAKLMLEQTTSNENLDSLDSNANNLNEDSSNEDSLKVEDRPEERLEDKGEEGKNKTEDKLDNCEEKPENKVETKSRKKFVRANALKVKSQSSK